MQTDEGVRVQPVTARGALAVDHRHLDVGLGHQRVDEGEAAGARSDDQIIGGDQPDPSTRQKARSFCSVVSFPALRARCPPGTRAAAKSRQLRRDPKAVPHRRHENH